MHKNAIYKVLAFMTAAFFSLVTVVYAQAPLRVYTCQKGEVAAHSFSSSATTYTFTEGANLNALWLKSDGTTATLSAMSDAEATPQTFTNNIPVPEFYFGNAKVKYFGFTGAGCLYFGTEDAILAASNPFTDINGSGKLKNFVYLEFLNGTYDAFWGQKRTQSTSVYAGANATVKYEIVDGTLFVGYENLKIYDNTNSTTLPLSFQYKITSEGNITLIPVSMQPTGTTNKETGANYFLFNLALLPGGARSNGIFLSDLDGFVKDVQIWEGIPEVEITDKSYPRGSYSFAQPGPCEAIAVPEVTWWGYTITTNSFEINPPGVASTAWKEGNKCIFILSTKDNLTGNDLPQNGTEYNDVEGLKIGSSVFAAVALAETNGSFLMNKSVSGLTPDTRYYLYAFPYNDDCSNFKYNTTNIPHIEIKTAMVAPTSLRAEESSITNTGYTLLVDKAGSNPYLLGVSERQISPSVFLNNRLPSKEGGYAKGDVITIGGEKIEVLASCSTDASYQVNGLTAGAERWYYVWSTRADQSEYSYVPICRGFATSRTIPADVDFEGAASNADISSAAAGGPAGWILDEYNDYPFYIYNRANVGKFLSVQMQQSANGSVAHSTAVSPVFESGDSRRAGAIFNLYFWRIGEVAGEYSASAPNRADTLYIQYRLDGQDAWTTIATVTNAANVNGGNLSVRTSAFETSGKNFRLRVLAASNHMPVGQEKANYASIKSLSLYVPCSEVSALQVSDVMHNSGLVTWEDRNTPRAGSYTVAWNKSDVAGTQQNMNVLVREASLKGLTPNTSYMVSVRAVCGAGDTSAEQLVPFTTYRGLPYVLKTTSEGSMPEEITFRTGDLPSMGNAVLQGVDAAKGVWTGDAQETDSTRIALNIATANNPLWLRLPVLSVGNIRGKAHFEAKLSGTSMFNAADTLFILLSTDSVFSRSKVLGIMDSSYFVETEKYIDFEFDVTNPYMYIAIVTKLGEAPETGALLASGIKVEWTDIYCDPVKSLRSSHLAESSVDISWSGEGVKYALLYREDETEKWDTIFTREASVHLEDLKSNTTYEYYVLTYCDEEGEKVSDKSNTRVFTTLSVCDVPTLELLEGTETTEGIVVVVLSPAPKKQLQIRPADLDECPYQMDVMDLQRDTTIVRGLTQCEAVTYYVKARAVCLAGASVWTEEQSFTTLKPSTDNFPLEKANEALRVRVTSDEIILENYTGEYVKELQAFSTTGRLLAVFPVNSAADVRLAHHLPQGAVLLRAVSENAGTKTFKVVVL